MVLSDSAAEATPARPRGIRWTASRGAPYLLGALLVASIALNARAFFHYQDPATREARATFYFHPIRLKNFTSLVEASALQRNRLIRKGTHYYYVAHEILKGRKVTMPRLSAEVLWPWRHIVLADIEIIKKEAPISRSQSRRYRRAATSVLTPGAISRNLTAGSPPIFVLIDPDAPPDQGVRIVTDGKGRLFMLPQRRTGSGRREGP